jgi:hypothetical protein
MRDRVDVQLRTLVPGGLDGQSTTVFADVEKKRWCKIETVGNFGAGTLKRNGVQILDVPHYTMVTRKPAYGLTKDHMILFKNQRYRMLSTDDMDARGEYLKFFLLELGQNDQEASSA